MKKWTTTAWLTTAVLAAAFSGCLPSSCNRTESRALFPADSTSRAIALETPVDTLGVRGPLGQHTGLTLEYPRTIAFAPDGALWIADTGLHRVIALETDGSVRGVIESGESSFPYLAGFRGDTVMVFNPQFREFVKYIDGKRVDFRNLAGEMPKRGALQFATMTGDSIYVKVIAEDFNGYMLRMDRLGMETKRWDLTGPYWRYAGLLRMWGDSLISLSGYRPIVHIASHDARLDTLRLQGFDSPMLARSRSFVLGDESQPPLLTASAVALGSRLYVLNMRPGWLNVDVYNHQGRLQHILTQPSPEFNQKYFPTDIAVKRRDDGSYELAVAVVEPEPRIERYIWRPRDREDEAE